MRCGLGCQLRGAEAKKERSVPSPAVLGPSARVTPCMGLSAQEMTALAIRSSLWRKKLGLCVLFLLHAVIHTMYIKECNGTFLSCRFLKSEILRLIMAGKSSLFKIILLGDGGVGKSSLMNRYVTNKFDTQLFHTIGVEFLNKDLEVDGHFVTMQIWDTAGQERFRSLRTPFYRGSDCCLLTFSVDDSQSFQNLSNWKKEFIYYADVKEPESFPFVILGNKIDISERQVSTEEAQAWCRDNGDYPYFETSAKDATNVAAAFEEAVRRVLATEDRSDHLIQTDTVSLHRKPKPSSSCC